MNSKKYSLVLLVNMSNYNYNLLIVSTFILTTHTNVSDVVHKSIFSFQRSLLYMYEGRVTNRFVQFTNFFCTLQKFKLKSVAEILE